MAPGALACMHQTPPSAWSETTLPWCSVSPPGLRGRAARRASRPPQSAPIRGALPALLALADEGMRTAPDPVEQSQLCCATAQLRYEGPGCDIDINECVRGTDDCADTATCVDSEVIPWHGVPTPPWQHAGCGRPGPTRRSIAALVPALPFAAGWLHLRVPSRHNGQRRLRLHQRHVVHQVRALAHAALPVQPAAPHSGDKVLGTISLPLMCLGAVRLWKPSTTTLLAKRATPDGTCPIPRCTLLHCGSSLRCSRWRGLLPLRVWTAAKLLPTSCLLPWSPDRHWLG